jgi:D-proline reductase (dithiol) PrdB
MRSREEKDDVTRRRSVEEIDANADRELADLRTDLLSNLRPGYSWIQHFKGIHPGWEFPSFEEIPWTPVSKPLNECKLAFVCLAGVYAKGQKPFNIAPSAVSDQLRRQRFKSRGDWSYREIPRDEAAVDLKVSHAHYDHSDADEDINCIFPIDRMLELEYENTIQSVNDIHFSLMGYVPEWPLLERDAIKQISAKLQRAQVDLILLSPGCLLSHCNMALMQRHLEQQGFSTLCLSLCADVTEQIGVPRAATLRFPLGNTFGAALDTMTQYRILLDAISAFEEIQEAGQILELPYEWVKAG